MVSAGPGFSLNAAEGLELKTAKLKISKVLLMNVIWVALHFIQIKSAVAS